MKKLFICCALAAFNLASIAQIKGRIVTTQNKPVASIVVSDGLNCVKSAADGSYSLPSNEKARFVSITKPTAMRTVGRHYIKYEGETKSYDFKLEASPLENNGKFSFVHITDVESSMNKRWIENLRDWIQANPTAFVINTGDICYEHGLAFNGKHVRTEQMGTDVFYTVGNHDLVKGVYGEKVFEDNFGPTYYSFDAGNVHFMVLPMLSGDYRPSYTKAQLIDWMKADLALKAPDKKVIMFNHTLWFQGDNLLIESGDKVLDMADHNLIALCYGHYHSHYAKTVAGIRTYSNSTPDKGGIDHGPSVFRVLDVDKSGNISSQTRYTYIDGVVANVLPASGDTLKEGVIPISVNAYRSASPTKLVSARIDNGSWIKLNRASDWNWTGRTSLAAGNHRLTVQASFDDGTMLVEHTDFTVASTTKPTVDWVAAVKGNVWMVAPVVAGGRVFTATIDDDNNTQCAVVAFDQASGRELWRARCDNSLKNTIVSDGNLVVACDSDGKLYGFDASTGAQKWKTLLSKSLLPHTLQGIALSEGVVYAGQGSGLSAVDLASGKVLWTNNSYGGGEGTTSTIVVAGDVVVASGHWSALFGHDKQTGKLLWKLSDSKVRFRDGGPTYYDGNLYLATCDELMLINPRSGDVLKRVACGVNFNVAASPVVGDKVIYCSTSDRGVAAFDRLTFKQLWNYNSSPSIFYSVPYYQDYQSSVECSPVLVGNNLFFGATDGYLYGVNVVNGGSVFKRRLGSPIFSTPSVVDGAMYVSDFAGNLLKIRIM